MYMCLNHITVDYSVVTIHIFLQAYVNGILFQKIFKRLIHCYSLKRLIGSNIKPKSYTSLCIGKIGIQLTRLRLGLSSLNDHRYRYNFIPNPNCNAPKTTFHLFFICPAYCLVHQTCYTGCSPN